MRTMLPLEHDPAGYEHLCKWLSETGHSLQEELWDLDEDERQSIPGPGEWSFHRLAFHLMAVEEATLDAVELICRQHGPVLDARDPNLEAEEADLDSIDMETCLYRLERARHGLLYHVCDLTDRLWQRAGTHPYRGRVTMAELLTDLSRHDLEHLWQIRREKQAARLAGPRRR